MEAENYDHGDLPRLFSEKVTTNKGKNVLHQPSGTKSSLRSDKLGKKTTGFEKIICDICGGQTTYREFGKHKKEERHKEKLSQIKVDNRKQRKQRAKDRKHFSGHAEPEIPAAIKSSLRTKPEVYYIRNGSLPEELQYSYTIILATFFALRLCFSKDKKDFSLSLFNMDWHEFGDIVLEFWENGELERISAVQCKQILNKSNILVSTLGSEMGKFSIKSRCSILKKLRRKSSYDLACFKLYTVSNLPVDKDDIPKFIYNDNEIKNWKSETEKKEWRDKQLIIREYKKMNPLNTTDEPNDINIFRIRGENSEELNKDLRKFMMFTNQKKTDSLKKLMKVELSHKFQHSKDVINKLVDFVKAHFSGIDTKLTSNKLTKNTFLVKLAELLLQPYIVCPENIKEAKSLPLWNKTVQNSDVIVVRNQQDIIRKMHTALNYIFQQRSVEDPEVRIKSSDLHLESWKANLTPLVLLVKDDNDLHLVIQVINFLHEEDCTLKFILTTDLKVDRSEFLNDLKVVMNLKDLKKADLFEEKIMISVLDFSVPLEEIVDNNPEFLESSTMDVLLNMLLKEYTFKCMYESKSEDVVTDSLVLSDDSVEKIKKFLKNQDDEKELKNLSYVVNMAGGPIQIDVPPQL